MNHTMLWVEDDADDVLLIGRAIRKAGIPVPALVRDGKEALEYLSGSEGYADRLSYPLPSIILLDLKLPKVSGFEVLKWVREQPELCRIPVIMFTSSREMTDVDRAYALGANAYLLKSVDHGDLVEALKRLYAFWMDLALLPSVPVHEVSVSAP